MNVKFEIGGIEVEPEKYSGRKAEKGAARRTWVGLLFARAFANFVRRESWSVQKGRLSLSAEMSVDLFAPRSGFVWISTMLFVSGLWTGWPSM